MTERTSVRKIVTAAVPGAPPPFRRYYSNAVRATAGDLLFVSGQVAWDEEGQVVCAGDGPGQTRKVFENLATILGAHGATLDDLVKITEDYVYDERGHLLTASFKDYQAPYATEVPELTNMREIPAPSQTIPGGQKGAGESGTGPVPAAIGNAVYDATGVRFTALPITPDRMLLAGGTCVTRRRWGRPAPGIG